MSTNYREEVDSRIRDLGFRSIEGYLRSKLSRIIRDAVLSRDRGICRREKCSKRASRIRYLGWSKKCLLGISPGPLLSVCPECYAACGVDSRGDPISLRQTIDRTLYYVLGLRKTQGESSPAVGYWFYESAEESKPTSRRIAREVRRQLPKFYAAHREAYECALKRTTTATIA